MTTPLRPMSTGEILDRTFNLYRNNFALFAGIGALPAGLLLIVQLIQSGMVASVRTPGHPQRVDAGLLAAGGIGIFFAVIAYMIGLAVAHGATVFAVSAVHLERTTTIGESYGRLRGRYGRVVWVIVQSSLRAFWPAAVLFMIAAICAGVMRAAKSGGASVMFGIFMFLALVAFVVGIFLYLRYALAVAACVVEDIKASAAIKRSIFLSAGCRGQIVLIYFLVGIINSIVTWVFTIPAVLVAGLVAKGSPALATLFTGLASFLAATLAGPIITIALSLVYFDQRVRKEAFDLQLMMAAVDGTPPPSAQAASVG